MPCKLGAEPVKHQDGGEPGQRTPETERDTSKHDVISNSHIAESVEEYEISAPDGVHQLR